MIYDPSNKSTNPRKIKVMNRKDKVSFFCVKLFWSKNVDYQTNQNNWKKKKKNRLKKKEIEGE